MKKEENNESFIRNNHKKDVSPFLSLLKTVVFERDLATRGRRFRTDKQHLINP